MDNGLIACLPTIVVIICGVIITVVLRQRKPKLKPRQKGMDRVAKVVIDVHGSDRTATWTEETLRTKLERAGACFRLEKYDEALDLCLQCVGFRPELPSAYSLLGSIYLAKGDYAAAVKASRRAIELEPGCTGAYLDLGQAHEAQGETESAFRAFNLGLEKGNIDWDYRRLASHFAGMHAAGRDYPSAVEVLDRALKRSPGDAELWYLLGVFSYDEGNYARAIPAYGEALSLGGSPRASPAKLHSELGRAYAAREEWEKAFDQHQYSIAMEPMNPDSHRWLAEMYFRKRDYHAAIAAFQDTIRLAPADARAYVRLGYTYLQQELYAEASEVLTKALTLKHADPETVADLYNLLTISYLGLKKYEDAAQIGQKALTLRSTTCPTYERDAHYHLGVALHELRRYPEAIEQLRLALALGGPGQELPALIHLRLGDIYVAINELDQGIEAYRQSLRRKPNVDAHIRLGGACLRLGRYQEGLLELQQAMAAGELTEKQKSTIHQYFGILEAEGYMLTS